MRTAEDGVTGGPSGTAMLATLARAVHLLWHEPPWVFEDWLAYPLIAPLAEERLAPGVIEMPRDLLDLQVAAIGLRSRLAEDALSEAIARGVRQYVILGAGLDSFAWRRRDLLRHLSVYEADHPATQVWKRRRLAHLQVTEPAGLTFVPVDFERDDPLGELQRAGFDATRPTFVSWLAVTPYITGDAVRSTLKLIATLAAGSQVVFTYMVPPETLSGPDRKLAEFQRDRFREMGEPWLSLFHRSDMCALLHDVGFSDIREIGPDDDGAHSYFDHRSDGLRPTTYERVVLATV